MMNAKIQLSKKKQTDEQFIQIPLNLEFSSLDKTDIINREFVSIEINKAINDIEDNEVKKLKLVNIGTGIVNTIKQLTININLNIDGVNRNTFLSDLGISFDDMKYRRNKMVKSFLRVELFDSPNIKTQKKITEYTLFLNMIDEYYDTTNNNMLGQPKQPSICRLKFKTYDPVKFLNNVGEGYNIFINKQHIGTSDVKNKIYVRYSFNSAITGISHKLCKSQSPLPISTLMDNLHFVYQTYQKNDGEYVYGIELGNNGTVNLLGVCELNLFECISI